jgi:hypothetical protein
MLGKAVKLRHCPATVSATAIVTVNQVYGSGRKSARTLQVDRRVRDKPLETRH